MGLFDSRPQPQSTVVAASAPRYGILLVDDEILNLTSLASLLEDHYQVFIASDANDALQLLADPAVAARVHVILSDQRMPGMSGVELLAHSRQLVPEAKRILLTGYTDIDAIIGAINEAAIYKYLRKPVDSHELLLSLQRACEAWQLEQDNQHLLAQLQQAYDKLRLLDADKMSFLRYLAHEMNTPLNWLSAAKVIEREQLGAEAREMLGYVDQGQDRLRGLITAVLRYFQAVGLELHTHRELVDLSLLLAQACQDLQRRHGERVMIRLEQPPTLTVESDAGLLAELLSHVLENAVSHAGRVDGHLAEVAIHVRLRERQIELEVFNSGEVLEQEALLQLFQPFLFCGSAHGREGFGLSLATARALALLLGGDIRASSCAQKPGVCLHIHLPEQMPLPDMSKHPQQPQPARSQAASGQEPAAEAALGMGNEAQGQQ